LNLPMWELNPAIDRASLARIEDEDPDLFGQEYRASFTSIGGSFFDNGKLAKATRPLPEHEHGTRVLGLDPAFDGDNFGLAIACVPVGDDSIVYLEHVEA